MARVIHGFHRFDELGVSFSESSANGGRGGGGLVARVGFFRLYDWFLWVS